MFIQNYCIYIIIQNIKRYNKGGNMLTLLHFNCLETYNLLRVFKKENDCKAYLTDETIMPVIHIFIPKNKIVAVFLNKPEYLYGTLSSKEKISFINMLQSIREDGKTNWEYIVERWNKKSTVKISDMPNYLLLDE